MLVKTKTGKYGRISKGEIGNLNIKVNILNENMHPLKGVYEIHKATDLIYRPEVIVMI